MPGIINSALYAFNMMGVTNPPINEFKETIGKPLQNSFKELLGYSADKVEQTVGYFRKYYSEKGIFECEAYPGILELVELLFKKGKKIYISTAKYEKFAKKVIEHYGLSAYITDLIGADESGKYASKTWLASQVIKQNDIIDLIHTVIVGDKSMDIEAGHNNNTDSIGVAYGFGTTEELENAKPSHIAQTVSDLRNFVL